jgi:alanine racemase
MNKERFANERTWIEISEKNLRHNMEVFRRLSGKAARIWVVKANAYGHGLRGTGAIIMKSMKKGEWLGADSLDEALELRKMGARAPVIVLGWIPPGRLTEAVRADLRITVSSATTVKALSRLGSKKPVHVHLKIDTGATRQGALPAEALALAELVRKLGLDLEGCATHFANIEDVRNPAYGDLQIERFITAVTALKAMGFALPVVHAACSAATMIRHEAIFTGVRIGIGLYGLDPSPLVADEYARARPPSALKPVLSWRSRIALLKTVPTGTPVGYGLTYRTHKKTAIAIVPVGYSDGYSRSLSSRGTVIIGGRRCPVIGRICMNMMIVDATGCYNAQEGDIVTLIGRQGKAQVTADELAEASDTINYEIVARIAQHLPRMTV